MRERFVWNRVWRVVVCVGRVVSLVVKVWEKSLKVRGWLVMKGMNNN